MILTLDECEKQIMQLQQQIPQLQAQLQQLFGYKQALKELEKENYLPKVKMEDNEKQEETDGKGKKRK